MISWFLKTDLTDFKRFPAASLTPVIYSQPSIQNASFKTWNHVTLVIKIPKWIYISFGVKAEVLPMVSASLVPLSPLLLLFPILFLLQLYWPCNHRNLSRNLEFIKKASASGPLSLLFHLPGTHFPQMYKCLLSYLADASAQMSSPRGLLWLHSHSSLLWNSLFFLASFFHPANRM